MAAAQVAGGACSGRNGHRPALIPWLESHDPFPPVATALADPQGLLAAGADLSMPRLVDAYRHGIFPWFGEGEPILWWSTDPRMVLYTDALRVSHTLGKQLRKIARDPEVEIRCDSAFERVIRECAAPRGRGTGTWIVPRMIDAYLELHRHGIAHSVETWMGGELAGGLYGLAIGRMFFGESMFSARPDASKIALVHLVDFVKKHGFAMLDCQQETAHLASMGARAIPRERFIVELRSLVGLPGIARWPARLTLSPPDHEPARTA